MVIYDGTEANKSAVKEKLKAAGFPSAVIENDKIFKTLISAQGAEADLIYVYNLKSDVTYQENKTSGTLNGDTQLQRIYTAVSRGKEFVLAEDASDHGLFSAWGIQSAVDEGIGVLSSTAEQF
jgi:hypothetical protein